MNAQTKIQKIRAKRLGVLIQSARLQAQKSLLDCANHLGVEEQRFDAYEFGEESPSYPELELLADYFDMPLRYFGGKALAERKNGAASPDAEKIIGLRQRIIGALIQQARTEQGMSADALADQLGISVDMVEAIELGDNPLPVPLLESICDLLQKPIDTFQDRNGPLGVRLIQKQNVEAYLELPEEVQNFIGKPINIPYLELAMRLSEMPVEKLRMIAEGLLEITL
jgi:transcriptional regulator with XRE-family HTH domain